METAKIALVCFFGAFIGSLIALQIGTFGWPIGAAVGAFVAYLGYNIEEVIRAIPLAYRRTTSWKPDQLYWSCWRKIFLRYFNSGFTPAMVFSLFVVLSLWLSNSTSMSLVEGITICISCSCAFAVFNGFSEANFTMKTMIIYYRREDWRDSPMVVEVSFPNFFKCCYWVAVEGVPRAIRWLAKTIPILLIFAVKVLIGVCGFMITFFRLVHSDFRLLCAVNAALGTVVGYFNGNAVIGAVTGALLGALSYEIITVRVMQVAGTKSFFR